MRSRLNWVVIHLPFDAAKVWRLRGQIKVKGEINGFAFRTSLFPPAMAGTFCWSTSGCRGSAGRRRKRRPFPDGVRQGRAHGCHPEEIGRILNQDRRLHRWYGG